MDGTAIEHTASPPSYYDAINQGVAAPIEPAELPLPHCITTNEDAYLDAATPSTTPRTANSFLSVHTSHTILASESTEVEPVEHFPVLCDSNLQSNTQAASLQPLRPFESNRPLEQIISSEPNRPIEPIRPFQPSGPFQPSRPFQPSLASSQVERRSTRKELVDEQKFSQAILLAGDTVNLQCSPSCSEIPSSTSKLYFKGLAITNALRIVERVGCVALNRAVFPLVSVYFREVIVSAQFIMFIAILVFSIIIATKGRLNNLDIINVSLSGIAAFLGLLDLVVIVCLQRCALCRRHIFEVDQQVVESNPSCFGQGGILSKYYMYVDVVRILLSELLLYPILICTILQFVLAFIDANDNYDIKFIGITVLFSLTIISMIVVVYIFRIYILCRAFLAIQKARGESLYRCSGAWLHCRLILHILAQMFSQVVMIVAIAGKFYYENLAPLPVYAVNVSSNLWYMIVAAFVIPFCGILSFTVLNYFSIREYPIKFLLDVLVNKSSIAERKVRDHFEDIVKATLWNRLYYVLTHAVLVPLSFAYFALLVAFVLCCISNVPYSYEYSQYVGFWYHVWIIYYYCSIPVIFISNIGVVFVVFVYAVVGMFAAVIVILAIPVCLPVACFCPCLFSK